MLYNNGTDFCVRYVDGTNEHYFGDGAGMDTDNAAWSPDGSKVALTESYRAGVEPDIWVLDVRSGALSNHTDDDVDGVGTADGDLPDGGIADAYPSWSADGKQIRFVRGESDGTIALMSVSAGGLGRPGCARSARGGKR